MLLPSRLWLLGLLACSLVSAEYYNTRIADKDYLLKQKKVYNLLYHVSQPAEINYTWYEEGQKWDIEANIDLYDAAAVKEFLYMYKNRMLPRGETFSIFYPPLLKEMMALFRLFYYANDFETFYKTALWARNNMNEAEYVLALYNAVIRRPDTQYIQLPPPYELYPHYFFNLEVMEKAQHASLFGLRETSGEYKAYILPANYSGWYLNRDYYLENKLNYFTEDIGLNSYYFFFRLAYPFWMPSSEFSLSDSLRGAEYLYGHQQLMNRYYLERLANDLPKLEDFDWQKSFYAGYYPTIIHKNGMPFPQRPEWSNFPVYKYKYVKDIIDRESRLTAAIDAGYVFGNGSKWYNVYNEEGLNILGNIIEGNADSYNRKFYGSIDSLGRKILGYNLEPSGKYRIFPSVLEIFLTSMRDPAFYRLYKRIMDLYYRYKMRQAPYSRDELIYPNLKIESFSIDKLITYFDQFDITINNGLFINENDKMSLVKVRQYRLNHKPFNFHITINSDKPMKAAIRIFLGPKYDSHHRLYELPENLKYFYEIDNWILDLNAGLNKISRNSQDCFFTIPDQEPSEIFYSKLMESLYGDKPFNYNERLFGFPERLLLPRGKKEGMPLQLFLYISPVSSEYQYMSRIWGNYKFDNRPFGFPLDKPLDGLNYNGPNMLFKDILIYHKDEFDMNIIY